MHLFSVLILPWAAGGAAPACPGPDFGPDQEGEHLKPAAAAAVVAVAAAAEAPAVEEEPAEAGPAAVVAELEPAA